MKKFERYDKVWLIMGHTTKLLEGIVLKVGRKYYTVGVSMGDYSVTYKFNKETLMQETPFVAGKLYASEQEYLDEQELFRNRLEINELLAYRNRHGITLDQTRRILDILKEGMEDVN